jgi:hypothetical protein
MVGAKGDDAAIVAKYRATPQFRQAWKIINPSREHRSECEWWVVHAILRILRFKEYPTPAEEKKELEEGIKKLRAAIPFVGLRLREVLKAHVRIMEILADTIVVEKGKPRRSLGKTLAVLYAYELLANFGGKPPTRHRKGAWHELSKVLFWEAKDLFDYLEEFRPSKPPLPLKKTMRLADLDAFLVGQRHRFL